MPRRKENIKVFCRIRPMNEKEVKEESKSILRFRDEDKTCLFYEESPEKERKFNFSRVFAPDATQEEVYTKTAQRLVSGVLQGFNGTIFAYGQTSSGKTYTMEGVLGDDRLEGISSRLVRDLFQQVESKDESTAYDIKISYVQIYLDKVGDLLLDRKETETSKMPEDEKGILQNLTQMSVVCAKDVLAAIEMGKKGRVVRSTTMNTYSSRSHTVFIITVLKKDSRTGKTTCAKLFLGDLAGSESLRKSQAEGQEMKETKSINPTVFALGNVIRSLVGGNKSHIPYRDSKLTMFLQEGLGGNSLTTIIICSSPASCNATETKFALEFGIKAQNITNNPIANEVSEENKREREKAVRRKSQQQCSYGAAETGRDVERVRFEEPSTSHAQLVEKDGVIGHLRNRIQELEEKIKEQDKLNIAVPLGGDTLQQQMHHHLQEAFRIMGELFIKFMKVSGESEQKERECKNLEEELHQKCNELSIAQLERESVFKMVAGLLKDIGKDDFVHRIDSETNISMESDKIIEALTFVSTFIGKQNLLTKDLEEKCCQLETFQAGCIKKIEANEKQLLERWRLINQYEAKLKSLQESLRKINSEKEILEKKVKSLKIESKELKETVDTQMLILKDKENLKQSAINTKEILERQIKQNRGVYQNQLSALHDQISTLKSCEAKFKRNIGNVVEKKGPGYVCSEMSAGSDFSRTDSISSIDSI